MFRNLFKSVEQQKFAKISLICNVFSGLENSLSTNCLFDAMMLDPVTGIASTYLARDAVSNISSLYVLNRWSDKIDSKPHKSLIHSQIFHQIAVMSDISTLFINSSLIIPVSGVGNVGRSISWITIGSLNAKKIQDLAPDNIGEMYSKTAMVNTIGQSIGTILGLVVIKIFPDKHVQIGLIPFISIIRIKLYSLLFKKLNLNE